MPIIDVDQRADPVPAPTLSGLPHDIPIDHRPIPALGMIVIKIYAFGGLAFLVGTILTAVSWWIWVVIINREYADSPPWLDLHPERMRAREVARIARLKAKKEEKRKERERDEKEKFSPPPLRLVKRDNRNRSSSAPISSAIYTSASSTKVPIVRNNETITAVRPKSSSVSTSSTLGKDTSATRPKSSSVNTLGKATLLNTDPSHTPPSPIVRPRKSSLSTGASKSPDKRVSWASSTATLDVNGCADVMPISGKSAEPHAMSFVAKPISSTTLAEKVDHGERHSRTSMLTPIPSHNDLLRTMPTARTSSPRVSAALDPHARRGQDMIAATTQDMATSWARELDNHDENGRCRCWISVDPLDRVPCDVHAPR